MNLIKSKRFYIIKVVDIMTDYENYYVEISKELKSLTTFNNL